MTTITNDPRLVRGSNGESWADAVERHRAQFDELPESLRPELIATLELLEMRFAAHSSDVDGMITELGCRMLAPLPDSLDCGYSATIGGASNRIMVLEAEVLDLKDRTRDLITVLRTFECAIDALVGAVERLAQHCGEPAHAAAAEGARSRLEQTEALERILYADESLST